MEFYYKWGRHYMPSVQRAHGIQQSNNFKDPGIQFYGGRLFLDVQADADDIFNSLPAPVPKHPIYQYGGGVAAAPAPVATTMASYNDRDAGCVHGDCSVVVVGSAYGNEVNFSGTKEVAVKDLKKGDIVRCSSPDASNSDDQKKLDIYGVVECVVELKCKQQKSTMQMVNFPNGLRITPWHPIRQEGSWKFPADLYPIEEVTCDSVPAVYCLVVRHLFTQADSDKQLETYQAAIMVNGIECATLGHGVIDDKVASHCFFGESSLVDLRQCQGWESGHVVFGTDCFVRDKASHLVTAFDLSKEILTTLLM